MKNILLPTILENDTLAALECAVSYAKGENVGLVLLLMRESDEYSASAFLRHLRAPLSVSQQHTLEACREFARQHPNVTLHLQRQSSISGPLLKNLLQALDIELVIVPKSYRESDRKINRYCIGLLSNCDRPILNLSDSKASDMQKALYLDYPGSKLQVQDIQQQLDGKFPFRIVSQARISREEEESLQQLLSETISRNDIDLLVETRKPAKVKLGKKAPAFHESLKLPVLSVFEQMR